MNSGITNTGDRLVAECHASRVVASLLILAVGSLPFAARGADSAPRKTGAPDKGGPIITADGRQPGDISLNGEWDFTYTPSSARENPELPPQSAFDAKIQVPGNWDDQLSRFQEAAWWPKASFTSMGENVRNLSGIGWHRTIIAAPSKWQNRSVTLTIGWAPGGNCYVWLNRALIGRYDYGMYTPCTFDLTGHLKPGENNELVVALDNTRGFLGGTAYYSLRGRAAGISGPVSVHVSDGPGRIADVYVAPGADLKQVVWQADLEVPGPNDTVPSSRLMWEVGDVAGKKTIACGETSVPGFRKQHQVTWKQRIPEIEPWSDRHPILYRTRIRWLVGKQSWDNREQRFGLRRWSRNGRKLFLNGQPIYLRGDNNGICDAAPDISIPTSKQYWMAYLGRAKELGYNFANFWSWVVPPQLLEAADELGMIIQCGNSVTAYRLTYRQYDYAQVWKPILAWTRGHPSMSIYGFGGECGYYEGVIEQYQRQNDFIKSMNPECLVMPQQAANGIEYHFESVKDKSVLTPRPFLHHAERLARYTKASDMFGSHIRGAFASGLFSFTPWRVSENDWTIYQRPIVEHEIYMKSSYLSPDNGKRYTGRRSPFVYTRLHDQLASAGLLDRWRTYWENSGRLNAIARKHCFEKLRKCDNLAGYEHLGFVDQNFVWPGVTYPCGMVDEFLQLKPGDTPEGILRYSNESVLLLDFEDGDGGLNRSYWAKESLPADIMVSLYGPQPLRRGSLAWTLRESQSGRVAWKGERTVENIANGHVSTLHSFKMEWPHVKKTTKVNLSVTLAGSGYRLANDWDFWVFPKAEPPEVTAAADTQSKKKLAGRYPKISLLAADSKEKLHVVSELTQNEVDYLARGGDVLLLGTRPLPVHIHAGGLYPGLYPAAPGRHGLAVGAVINTKHPVLKDLPDEGWGDWIFMPLLARAPRVFFDKSECSALEMTPFHPIVEMISEPSRVDKLATVFEARVGKGRLLVSTCPVGLTNPSQVTLLDGLLRYAAASDFRPEMKLGREVLTALLQGQRKPKPPVAAVPSAPGVKAADGREWHNNTVTVDFKSNVFYRVNDGAWQEGVSVEISRVGIHKLRTKPAADSAKEEIREVGVDLTPPTIFIRATPEFEQSASVLHVVPDASLTIEAKDDLSGVRSIEVSLDGAEYRPYAGPFKLPAGTHSVRCRVTDWAGNQEETMDGENVGEPSRNMVITVRRPKDQ